MTKNATQEAVAAIKGIVGTIGEVSRIAGSIAAAVEAQGAAAELFRQAEALSGEVSGRLLQSGGKVVVLAVFPVG